MLLCFLPLNHVFSLIPLLCLALHYMFPHLLSTPCTHPCYQTHLFRRWRWRLLSGGVFLGVLFSPGRLGCWIRESSAVLRSQIKTILWYCNSELFIRVIRDIGYSIIHYCPLCVVFDDGAHKVYAISFSVKTGCDKSGNQSHVDRRTQA